MKKYISKEMLLSEVVEKFPKAAEALVEEYGFHCIGCYASQMETLEEGAAVHGMSSEDIEVMLENLNEIVEAEAKVSAGKE